MSELKIDSHVFVVFGGRGDLMARKLLPALYHITERGSLGPECAILAVGRTGGVSDDDYRQWARKALADAGITVDDGPGKWCDECLFYQTIGEETAEDYATLKKRIEEIESARRTEDNRIFYLALPPGAFPATIERLRETGLSRGQGWTRIVVEKPFGRDLESARELNGLLHTCFDENQIYRIDHYLGKETVQNLLVFRFANSIFESLWNRDRIDNVQISVGEEIGIDGRAGYYDRAGAIRDMMQNHVAQLVSLIAMEVPAAFQADAIRYEKAKVLRSIAEIGSDDVVLGQYGPGASGGREVGGYREVDGVAPNSRTETFAAIRLEIANWRWQGVPFYVRTGKRLPVRTTRIVIVFRYPPVSLFEPFHSSQVHSNTLVITLQPDEGFDLTFEVKSPGEPVEVQTQKLDFHYEDVFAPLPDAYETLLLDIMTGDQTLFVHSDEVEASWKLFDPVIERHMRVYAYPSGTWGPEEADALLNRDGRRWRNL